MIFLQHRRRQNQIYQRKKSAAATMWGSKVMEVAINSTTIINQFWIRRQINRAHVDTLWPVDYQPILDKTLDKCGSSRYSVASITPFSKVLPPVKRRRTVQSLFGQSGDTVVKLHHLASFFDEVMIKFDAMSLRFNKVEARLQALEYDKHQDGVGE